jgi:hypothetical protein
LLLTLLALLPACAIFGSGDPPLPPSIPPNFIVGMRVLEAADPPVDYQIKIDRTGKVEYETTIRVPRRRRFDGTLQLLEADVVDLYGAVLASAFHELDQRYDADPGDDSRRENGERVFFVEAGDLDKRVDINYMTLAALDALQEAIVAKMPDHVLTGGGGPGNVLGRPEAFVGDRDSKVFHHPACELCEKIDASNRDSYTNEFDALNFGYHPCGVCNPLETRE